MRIRSLSHQDIDTAVVFLQAMLNDMASFGGHPVHESDSVSNWFLDCIRSQIDDPDHLFLGAVLNTSSSHLIGILEASISHLDSVFQSVSSLHIHAVYVVPEYRRSGIARSLMEAAFTWGREQGCTEADLNVLRDSPARSLYEELGFAAFQIEMRRKL